MNFFEWHFQKKSLPYQTGHDYKQDIDESQRDLNNTDGRGKWREAFSYLERIHMVRTHDKAEKLEYRIGIVVERCIPNPDEFQHFLSFYRWVWCQGHKIILFFTKENEVEKRYKTFLEANHFDQSPKEKLVPVLLPEQATPEDQLKKIASHKCTHFVDTSPALFETACFPKSVQFLNLKARRSSLRLPRFHGWAELHTYFQAAPALKDLGTGQLTQVEAQNRSRSILRLSFSRGARLVLKKYPNDQQKQNEWKALNLFWKAGIYQVPQPLKCMDDSLLLLSSLTGTPMRSLRSGDEKQLSHMLIALNHLSSKVDPNDFGVAVQAKLRLQDYLGDLEQDWLRTFPSSLAKEELLLGKKLLWREKEAVKEQFDTRLAVCSLAAHHLLPPKCYMISSGPSLWQSCLRDEQGGLFFCDFKNLGWDDPAHLLAMMVIDEQIGFDEPRKKWLIDEFIQMRPQDPTLKDRLSIIIPLLKFAQRLQAIRTQSEIKMP